MASWWLYPLLAGDQDQSEHKLTLLMLFQYPACCATVSHLKSMAQKAAIMSRAGVSQGVCHESPAQSIKSLVHCFSLQQECCQYKNTRSHVALYSAVKCTDAGGEGWYPDGNRIKLYRTEKLLSSSWEQRQHYRGYFCPLYRKEWVLYSSLLFTGCLNFPCGAGE